MAARPKNAAAALRVIPEDDPGLTLEDLFSDTVTFEMTVKGRVLQVTWAPARYTPVLEEQSLALAGAGADEDEDPDLDPAERERLTAEKIRDENRAIREFLAGVVVSWSLRTATGEPVGTDLDTLRALPQPFLREVFAAMTENAGPKDATEPPSDPSSSPTA